MLIIYYLVKISSFRCLYIVPIKISLRWLVFSRDNVEDMITISSSRLFIFIGKIKFMIMTVCVCMCACIISHAWLFVTPMDCMWSMEFFRQEYWNGLPFPTPGDLPDPGIELMSLVSPSLAGGVFNTVLPVKLLIMV